MGTEIPTSEPASVTAGDTLKWKISLPDYPASEGWVMSYRLINAGQYYDITATADGDDHSITVLSATSANWIAGTYQFNRSVTKNGERHTLITGSIEIKPDLAAQTVGLDPRTHARKTLDALEAWIEARNPGVASYEIAGRQMQYYRISELLSLRDRYRADVRAEEAAQRVKNGGTANNRILVRL